MTDKIKFYPAGIDDFGTPAEMKVKNPLYVTIITKEGFYEHGYTDYSTPCGELFEYLTQRYKGCKNISIGALW